MEDDVQEIKETPYQMEINKAWDEFHNDNIDASQQICLALIDKYPDKSSCHYLLAHIHRKKKQLQLSADEFQLALEKDDGSNAGYIYYWLGEIYGEYGWGDDENTYIYDSKKSVLFYEQAKTCESYPAQVLFKNDYKLRGKQKVDNYELGISKFPDIPDFYIKLCHHYEQLGLSELQLLTLERALKNDWSSPSIFYNLGLLYYKKGDFKIADDYFNKALSSNIDRQGYNFAINYWLGRSAEKNGDFNKSEAYYLTAYKDEKDHPDKMFGFLGLISVYIQTNNRTKLDDLIINLEIKAGLISEGGNINGGPIHLSEYATDSIHFEQLKDLYKQFNKVTLDRGNDHLNGKIWLVRAFISINLSKYNDQYKAVINARKYINGYQYDFLDDLHVQALRDLLFNRGESIADVTKLYNILIKDLDAYDLGGFLIEYVDNVVDMLFEHSLYDKLVAFSAYLNLQTLKESNSLFKIAFSYANTKNYIKAKQLYNDYLTKHGDNSAVLNNLGILLANDNKHEEATELYKRGLLIAPDDVNLNNNLKLAVQKIEDEETRINKERNLRQEYLTSTTYLKSENDWVLDKLLHFIAEVKKDEGFDNWEVPLAKFKFQKYLNVDKQRTESLIAQWLNKGYLKDTGYRHDYNVVIYAVNPFIEDEIKRVQKRKIPKEWIDGFVQVSVDTLDVCGYFSMMDKIAKVNKKFRDLLERDFKELTYNYLVGHEKATIVLSGSLVELALIYYCEKKKFSTVSWNDNKGNVKTKKLYDCVLNDLIMFIEQSKAFGADFTHLSNLSRLYRNFVHPGKELKSSLDKSKANICYLSTVEILKNIL